MFTRIAIALLWLLHFLPLSVLATLGRFLGLLLYKFAARRRFIVRVNLAVCFPELGEEEREAMTRVHMQLLGRSLLGRHQQGVAELLRSQPLTVPRSLYLQALWTF